MPPPTRRPILPGQSPDEEPAGPGVSSSTFREALAHWATGVTIVAVRDDPRVYATTATAFTSVSARPPLVLVSVGPNAQVLPFLRPDAAFGISILGQRHRRFATIFADPFPVGPSPFPPDGPPTLPDSLVALHCTVHDVIPAGDHRLILARVDQATLGDDDAPLIHYHRNYHGLPA